MSRRGYTLVELLVVLSIMGLLAIVALPALPEDVEDRLDNAQLQVEDAVAYAAALSRSSKTPHGVVFDPTTDRFAVVDATGAAVTDPLTRREYVIGFDEPGQPRGVEIDAASFAGNGTAAIFDGQGVPVLGGTVILSCRGGSRTLQVDAATGEISIP